MVNAKPRCSQCGREIKTVGMVSPLRRAPLICKYCFGEETYRGPARGLWSVQEGGMAGSLRGSRES
jgi:hypothetical protein